MTNAKRIVIWIMTLAMSIMLRAADDDQFHTDLPSSQSFNPLSLSP